MPLEGVQFIHRDWNIVKSCRPRDVSRHDKQQSSHHWAMSCIQMDLRHHIGRVSGTTTLDGRGSILLHEVIRCDEGGWVSIDDLVRMEVLWTARSRDITESANVRDRDQRMRVYNERLQLIINGNLLNGRKQGGKIRLQFLGVRLKEPSAGPYSLGAAGSNMMVSRQDQITELQRDHNTRHEQQWLGQCDGWIRPWAVRALSGHTVHYDPAKNLMELDPHKFAICPPLSLVNQIGGAFHATSCRKLFSMRGAWDPSGNQHPRRSVCKVRYRRASQLLWCLCSVGFQEHHNKTKSEWSRKLWNAAGRSLHSHCGPHQAARKNYRQRQHHREPSRAFQPREGGLVLRTERQYQQLDRKKTTTWTP